MLRKSTALNWVYYGMNKARSITVQSIWMEENVSNSLKGYKICEQGYQQTLQIPHEERIFAKQISKESVAYKGCAEGPLQQRSQLENRRAEKGEPRCIIGSRRQMNMQYLEAL